MNRYEITIKDWPEATHTIDAATAAQARWKTVKALREAGYLDRRKEWPRGLKARRVDTDKKLKNFREAQP